MLGLFAGLIILAGLFAAVRNRTLRFAAKTGWLCFALLVLVIVMPTSVLGIWGLHLRFLPILIILVAACALPTLNLTQTQQRRAGFIAAGLGAILFINGALQMSKIDSVTSQTREILSVVPQGSTVLTSVSGEHLDYAPIMNASATVVIDRSGYVPGLFTNTSPVDIAPAYAGLHMPQSQPLLPTELENFAVRAPVASKNGFWNLGYAFAWPETFDYLLYYKAESDPALTLSSVCAVQSSPTLILYATQPCALN